MIASILISIPLAIFVLAGVGTAFNSWLTKYATKGKKIVIWKISCFMASLFKWVFVWAALDVVLLLLWVSDIANNHLATTLIGVFVGGPVAGYIVAKGGGVIDDYWKLLAKSLEDCNCLDSNQMSNFNHERPLLESGKYSDRKIALNKVLFPKDEEVVLENYPSGPED